MRRGQATDLRSVSNAPHMPYAFSYKVLVFMVENCLHVITGVFKDSRVVRANMIKAGAFKQNMPFVVKRVLRIAAGARALSARYSLARFAQPVFVYAQTVPTTHSEQHVSTVHFTGDAHG